MATANGIQRLPKHLKNPGHLDALVRFLCCAVMGKHSAIWRQAVPTWPTLKNPRWFFLGGPQVEVEPWQTPLSAMPQVWREQSGRLLCSLRPRRCQSLYWSLTAHKVPCDSGFNYRRYLQLPLLFHRSPHIPIRRHSCVTWCIVSLPPYPFGN